MTKAKKFFITAIKRSSLFDVLTENLPVGSCVTTIIQSGGVWFQRQRIMDISYRISERQTVIVYISSVQGKRFKLNHSMIIDETADFIIVNKPSGLTTVSDRSNITYNLIASLEDYHIQKGECVQLSPMTRLDFMVSGLVLVTKHKQATRDFSKQTKERKIGKYYICRMKWFDSAPRYLRCIDYLSHAGKAYVDSNGKRCESLFIKRFEDVSNQWLEYGVKLFTGRRHQIRFHASQYLSVLLGDGLYGDRSIPRETPISLCAFGLNFKYKGKRYRYRLKNYLNK